MAREGEEREDEEMARNFTDWMSALMHYGIPGMRKGVRRVRKVMGGGLGTASSPAVPEPSGADGRQ